MELDVAEPRAARRRFSLRERGGRRVDRDEMRARAAAREFEGLRADAAARFENARPRRELEAAVQEIRERPRLIFKPAPFPLAIAVNIVAAHLAPQSCAASSAQSAANGAAAS